MNELLILGFDVYAQPVDRTGRHSAAARSRPVEGLASDVGGPAGLRRRRARRATPRRKQFWIDAERLLVR